jgi:hypothetical protein
LKRVLLTYCLLIAIVSQAQLFGKKDLGLSFGGLNFHSKALNNSVNTNYRVSKITEVDKHVKIKRLSSLELGFGFGTLENLDNRFSAFESSQFFRIKTALLFHLDQRHNPSNWSPKRVNPYIKVGYNLDWFDYKFKNINERSLGSSMALGVGLVIKINHAVGLRYEFTHNQRITEDYRTYFQNSLGLIINLDQAYLEK